MIWLSILKLLNIQLQNARYTVYISQSPSTLGYNGLTGLKTYCDDDYSEIMWSIFMRINKRFVVLQIGVLFYVNAMKSMADLVLTPPNKLLLVFLFS